VKNGHAIQVIVGMNVPQVRSYFDALLKGGDVSEISAPSAPTAAAPDHADKGLAMGIKACVSGQLIDMTEVKDEMFSKKMMGDGVAIEPTGDTVVAPADAEVTMVMVDSNHAVGLRFENGAELLIHIGIDTVNLKGQGFECYVKQGDKVKAGQKLIKFDKQVIADAGYANTVMMAITNSAEYPQLKKAEDQKVVANETTVISF
jgi:PTS system arbutin-like IIC component